MSAVNPLIGATLNPPALSSNWSSTAKFVGALVIMVIVLKLVQAQSPRLTWPYIVLVLAGIAVYQREGVTEFLQSLTSQIGG